MTQVCVSNWTQAQALSGALGAPLTASGWQDCLKRCTFLAPMMAARVGCIGFRCCVLTQPGVLTATPAVVAVPQSLKLLLLPGLDAERLDRKTEVYQNLPKADPRGSAEALGSQAYLPFPPLHPIPATFPSFVSFLGPPCQEDAQPAVSVLL